VAALKRDPRAPLSDVTEFVHDNGSYFWDMTLVLRLRTKKHPPSA
jgi:hypothetical protein